MARRTGVRNGRFGWLAGVAAVLCTSAHAEPVPSYNTYGLPGMIDMPTAEMAPDGEIALTYGQIGGAGRTTLSFQILPRLVGAFRYSGIRGFKPNPGIGDIYYDRSFDLRYQLFTEGRIRPSVVVGLQDFIGTGIYNGEYIVATKTVWPGVKLTGGLGWGRLGSYNTIATLSRRPENDVATGGTPTVKRFFRGDVAPFAGITFSPNERTTYTLEYSSDAYPEESVNGDFDHKSAINLGFDYRFKGGAQVSLYYAYGNEFGAQVTLPFNPRTLGLGGGIESAGLPVKPREPSDVGDLGWTTALPETEASTRQRIAKSFERERLEIEAFKLEPRRATLRLRNPVYGAPAQAIGRAARIMSRTLPASVEEFVIVPSENGMAMSAITLRRSDLEALENDAAVEMLARTQITDAFGIAPRPELTEYPKFTWSLAPYYLYSAFDPKDPFRYDIGARLSAEVRVTPNFVLSGSIRKKVFGNLDETRAGSESKLPRVRTDYGRYASAGDPGIDYLTAAWYGRPGRDLYSRLTVGYLEMMYAGASAEVLWKPVGSRLALGAELNYVQRRDFDTLFGVQSNTTTDPVSNAEYTIPHLNGHLSAYYKFNKRFHGQLDVGRYLAGDYGATLTMTREFQNGWRVGAYATLTNVSPDDFGEGSFDKGIIFEMPLAVGTGTPSRKKFGAVLRSVQRDGGARLNVNGRLYEQVRTWHEPEVAASWGRFWR